MITEVPAKPGPSCWCLLHADESHWEAATGAARRPTSPPWDRSESALSILPDHRIALRCLRRTCCAENWKVQLFYHRSNITRSNSDTQKKNRSKKYFLFDAYWQTGLICICPTIFGLVSYKPSSLLFKIEKSIPLRRTSKLFTNYL